ncbi:MAG: amidohydrolase family protein [Xanthomonadales bacterium]|nr:amidohydrolase family protein [Xanthomonadales bacterium]NIX13826.1 amidohydrolase family protein [Xanthomonadales bacterium]
MLQRALFGLLLLTGFQVMAQDATENTEETKPKWEVSSDLYHTETVTIDTRETTWSNVTVSPDGETLVFDMLGDLYSVPIEGGEAAALTDGIEWNFQPRFSPDGNQIAFVSDRAGGDNIWVMQADGSDPRAITDEAEHIVHNPAWSPDGEFLVGRKGYYSTRSIAAGEIWMFHHGGGNGVNLVERPNKAADQKNRSEPVFSPDGKYVYYAADITPGRTWQYNKDAVGSVFAVQRLELATGETTMVVSGPGGAIRPTPSPDGKSLAYLKRRPGLVSQIWLKDLESGLEKMLFDGFERDLQESSGSEGNAPAFAWMPDGGSIVFWTAGKFHRVNVADGGVSEIPVHVTATKKVRPTLRYEVDFSPESFAAQAIRWAAYTPDGDQVVFQALGYIWVRDLDDGGQRRLTRQSEHTEFYPVVSPDGRSVLYTTWNDNGFGSVRITSLNGRRTTTLTTEPGHYIEPAFSTDGSQVLFRKIGGGYLLSPLWSLNPGIYRVPADGGSAPERVIESGSNAHFSADGERVYYSASTGELDTELKLHSVNLEGKDPREHLHGKKVTQFRVSPNGRWVAFTENYKTYLAPYFSNGKTIKLDGGTKGFKVAQAAGRTGEFLAWSADSSAITWSHGRYLYRRDLNQSFAFLQGAPEKLPEPETTGLDLAFEQPSDVPQGSIALVGGRVVTMRNADHEQEVIEDGVVVIEGNRIMAVGARGEVDLPSGAFVLDTSGKTVLPGLVDAHAHGGFGTSEIMPQQNWMQFSNLAFGVTTIHDPSNDTSEIFAAAELQKAGRLVAPRIFGTGTILYGAYAPGYSAEIKSLEDAQFHLHRLKDVGAISVKSYNQPRRDQRQQVIQAAAELGMMVVPEGGMKFQHNLTELIDGHTTIEHSVPVQNVYEDVRQLWSQVGTAYTPTFNVSYGGLMGEEYWYDRTNVWENERLMRYTPKSRLYPRSIRRPKAPDAEYNHVFVASNAKALRDRGVRVNIGAHGQREGLAAHWEMWMMDQGGFTPWEALRGATWDPAASLGMEHAVGSIEVGKLADIAVIEGNPLEDLSRSEYVSHTVINGRLYEAATMNQVAPEAVSRQPLFFELEGGDSWSVGAQEAWQRKAEALHWRH